MRIWAVLYHSRGNIQKRPKEAEYSPELVFSVKPILEVHHYRQDFDMSNNIKFDQINNNVPRPISFYRQRRRQSCRTKLPWIAHLRVFLCALALILVINAVKQFPAGIKNCNYSGNQPNFLRNGLIRPIKIKIC